MTGLLMARQVFLFESPAAESACAEAMSYMSCCRVCRSLEPHSLFDMWRFLFFARSPH